MHNALITDYIFCAIINSPLFGSSSHSRSSTRPPPTSRTRAYTVLPFTGFRPKSSPVHFPAFSTVLSCIRAHKIIIITLNDHAADCPIARSHSHTRVARLSGRSLRARTHIHTYSAHTTLPQSTTQYANAHSHFTFGLDQSRHCRRQAQRRIRAHVFPSSLSIVLWSEKKTQESRFCTL